MGLVMKALVLMPYSADWLVLPSLLWHYWALARAVMENAAWGQEFFFLPRAADQVACPFLDSADRAAQERATGSKVHIKRARNIELPVNAP